MALLHATQLYQGIVTSATPVAVYTVPAGDRIILRQVTFMNQSAFGVTCQLRLDAAGTIWAPTCPAYGPPGVTLSFSTWMVLGPGQIISVNPGVAARPIAVNISGSLYTI